MSDTHSHIWPTLCIQFITEQVVLGQECYDRKYERVNVEEFGQ